MACNKGVEKNNNKKHLLSNLNFTSAIKLLWGTLILFYLIINTFNWFLENVLKTYLYLFSHSAFIYCLGSRYIGRLGASHKRKIKACAGVNNLDKVKSHIFTLKSKPIVFLANMSNVRAALQTPLFIQ